MNAEYAFDQLMNQLDNFIKSDTRFKSTTRCKFHVVSNFPEQSLTVTVEAKDYYLKKSYEVELKFPCLEDKEHIPPLELL